MKWLIEYEKTDLKPYIKEMTENHLLALYFPGMLNK